jgi:hypothetical protein
MTKADFTYDKVKTVILKKGYGFTIAEGQLNMIGVRSSNRAVDNWDDFFLLLYIEGGKKTIWVDDTFTTDPGIHYMQTQLLNAAGCGILAEGQHKNIWNIGKHGQAQYEAFVQTGGKVKAYRDRNKDSYMDFDPKSIQEGYFGCNQHHGYDSVKVGKNSAMCQVHKFKKDLSYVLTLAKKSKATAWDYTVLNEVDFK